MAQRKDFLLGESLIKRGFVTLEQVNEALKEKEKSGEYLGQALTRLGYLREDQLMEALSEQLGVPYLKDLPRMNISSSVLEKVPAKLASYYQFLPISLENRTLTICTSNPVNFRAFDEIRALLGYELDVMMSDSKSIEHAIREHYGIGAEVLDRIRMAPTKEPLKALSIEKIDEKGEDASIIELVNQLLMEAQKSGASDLHLEPFQDSFEVRYRIDGILQRAKLPAQIKRFQDPIISRIKIMAGLDIAEKRLPQDGRVLVKTKSGEIDLRVSIIPSPHGEAVMIRMLQPHMILDLKKLHFTVQDLKQLQNILKKPSGMILVTGPTGSGKTTTLYACLKKLNTPERKILTIEDPIEYELKGVLQMQVQSKIGLTFAACLRHALRHDPDVMMVGEIRDTETAQIASRAALTGHLVFSTLHTRDTASAVTRLIDMGVEPYLVASSMEVVMAQRLVRMICENCKAEVKNRSEEVYGKLPGFYKNRPFFEGKGCNQCHQTGYQGRLALHEIMIVDDEISKLITQQHPSGRIRELAIQKGMHSLWENGLEKASEGFTTLDELLRVAPEERIPQA